MTDRSKKAEGRVLLPDYAKPERYDLKVTPDMVNYTFEGLVAIDMTTAASIPDADAKKITLHAKELLFRSAKFVVVDGGTEEKSVDAEEVSVVESWRVLKFQMMFFSFGFPSCRSTSI